MKRIVKDSHGRERVQIYCRNKWVTVYVGPRKKLPEGVKIIGGV